MTEIWLVAIGAIAGTLIGFGLASIALMQPSHWTVVSRIPHSIHRDIKRSARRRYWSTAKEIQHRLRGLRP
jgi:hypothetical protein